MLKDRMPRITPADINAWLGSLPVTRRIVRRVKPLALGLGPLWLLQKAGRRTAGLPLGTAATQLTGTSVRDNLTSGKTQFNTLMAAVRRFRPDGIGIISDLSIEAQACGCEIKFPEDGLPFVSSKLLENQEDLKKLRLPDPYRAGRMPVVLETIRLLSRKLGLAVGSGGIGPFTLAGELIGTERAALAVYTEPDFLHAVLRYATEVVISYQLAQISSGSDTVIIGEPTGSILSPQHFREFAAGYLTRIIKKLPVPVTLHICGDCTHLLDEIALLPIASLSVDAPVNLVEAAGKIPAQVILSGNLDPVTVVRELDPDGVRAATLKLLKEMDPYPNFLLSTGCDITPDTPVENIEAILKAVREYKYAP